MSYLLKAMEKAQQEREAIQNEPQENQQAVVVSAGLPWPVLVLAMVVLVLTLWQLIPVGSSQESEESAVLLTTNKNTGSKSKLKENIMPLESGDKAIENQPDNAVVGLAGYELIEPQNHIQQLNESPSKTFDEVKEEASEELGQGFQVQARQLEELSASELKMIPSLQLESHIYSSSEEYRSVVINGRSFNQGQWLNPSVVLKTITEDGIVIQVNNMLVVLPKGISWVASHGQ